MSKDEFCRMIQRYQGEMYLTAYQILQNEMDVDDAVSEGVIKAFKGRNNLRNKAKFSPWICQIIKREALNIIRTQKKEEEICKKLLESRTGEDHLRGVLSAAVMELPDDCRNEMILYYYCGLSVREISELKEIPLGTVKSRLYRGKGMLRSRFQIESIS